MTDPHDASQRLEPDPLQNLGSAPLEPVMRRRRPERPWPTVRYPA
jgi:hypothetical protein